MMLADTILHGDALAMLRTLPDACVHAVVTSPPYWGGLRDYGVHGQLGLEATPEEYVERMVEVFSEVRRALRADGTLWLNMGDCYANDGRWGGRTAGKHAKALHGEPIGRSRRHTGLKPKDLVGMPWRLAFALQADGWWLRSDVIWHKPNPMPESVTDRPVRAHEYLFLLAKSERYFYDADAIRTPVRPKTLTTYGCASRSKGSDGSGNVRAHNWAQSVPVRGPKLRTVEGDKQRGQSRGHAGFNDRWDALSKDEQQVTGASKRDVWTVGTQPFRGAHFATFPPALIEPCILAGTSPRVCEGCGAPWRLVVEREPTPAGVLAEFEASRTRTAAEHGRRDGFATRRPHYSRAVLWTQWRPTCGCEGSAGSGRALVLDPFFGAGTVGVVCRRHSRSFLGIEINQAYIEMAERRIAAERQPVLWTV